MVRRIVVTNEDIKVSIAVDIHEGGASRPCSPRRDSRGLGSVREVQRFLGLEIEPVVRGSAGEENIRPTISV